MEVEVTGFERVFLLACGVLGPAAQHSSGAGGRLSEVAVRV